MEILAQIVERLPRASIEGAAFVLVVAVACRLLPRLRAKDRAALWWLAAAKMLLGLMPVAALSIAVLPAPSLPAVDAVAGAPVASVASDVPAVEAPAAPAVRLDARRLLEIGWAGGVMLFLAASCAAALRAFRLRRSGAPFVDPAVRDAAARAAAGAGLRAVPPVLAVPGLSGPMVAGILRPSILLPAEASARMTGDEIAMALAHEMAHVARHDLAIGLVPALARRLFFFHPLAWLAEREYVIAREAACDATVVARTGADAQAYGRLLLRLATARPVPAAATFSPRSMLRRRLEMIESTLVRSPFGRGAGWAVLALAAVLLVPVRLVASEPAPAAAPATAAAPAASRTPAPEAAPSPANAPTPATAPTAAAAIAAAPPCVDGNADSAYVVFDGSRRYVCGDEDDVRRAARHRKGHEDMVWFRVGHEAWIVRDPDTVAEMKAAATRQRHWSVGRGATAADRAALGRARVESERDRAELERERRAAARDAELARRDAEAAGVRRQVTSGAASADDAELARLQAKLDALQAQIADVARQMDQVAKRQVEAGVRQERAAREMVEKAAGAHARAGEILDRAREQGTAKRVPE